MSSISIRITNNCSEDLVVCWTSRTHVSQGQKFGMDPGETAKFTFSQMGNVNIMRVTGTALGTFSGGLFGLEKTFEAATYRGLEPGRVSHITVKPTGIWESGRLVEEWADISPGKLRTGPGIG